jgi:hypothetical protein
VNAQADDAALGEGGDFRVFVPVLLQDRCGVLA